jgi:hypothetical protein
MEDETRHARGGLGVEIGRRLVEADGFLSKVVRAGKAGHGGFLYAPIASAFVRALANSAAPAICLAAIQPKVSAGPSVIPPPG